MDCQFQLSNGDVLASKHALKIITLSVQNCGRTKIVKIRSAFLGHKKKEEKSSP